MTVTDDAIVREFLVETYEGLDRLEADLTQMEDEPGSAALLSSVFRTVHTLKGVTGFLGLPHLESLAHAGEDLLVRVRDGLVAPSPAHADALLDLAIAARATLDALEATGAEPDVPHVRLVEQLRALATDTDEPDVDPSATLGEILVARGVATQDQLSEALTRQRDGGDRRPVGDILVSLGAARESIDAALRAQSAARRSLASATVRVEVDLLESLVRLADDLGEATLDVARGAGGPAAPDLQARADRSSALARRLQRRTRRTLVRPLGTIWTRVPRMVRDVARTRGREVVLELEGGETEVDVAVLDALRDPLTHLVRNAVDHGIEPPAVREAAGKPRAGLVRVTAVLEGGSVVVDVSDDGAGLDEDAIVAAALERGIVDAQRLAGMDREARRALVLEPGLSTAAQVDVISGRGVGMDVVRAQVERVGGTIGLLPRDGGGTVVRLVLAVPGQVRWAA